MKRLKKLFCQVRVKLVGFERAHAWRAVPGGQTRYSSMQACTRCGEVGWLLR